MIGRYPVIFQLDGQARVINKKYTKGGIVGGTAALNRAARECRADETYSVVEAETYAEAIQVAKTFPRPNANR